MSGSTVGMLERPGGSWEASGSRAFTPDFPDSPPRHANSVAEWRTFLAETAAGSCVMTLSSLETGSHREVVEVAPPTHPGPQQGRHQSAASTVPTNK